MGDTSPGETWLARLPRPGIRTALRRTRRRFSIEKMKSKVGMRQMAIKPALSNLAAIDTVMRAYDCDYWLMAGTLLGKVRNNDFIRHDGDTDLAVRMSTFSPRVLADLVSLGFTVPSVVGRPLVYGMPNDGMEICIERFGVKTDLFFTYPRGLEGLYCSVYHDVKANSAAIVDYVYPDVETEDATLRGLKLRAPVNAEEVLELQYGPEWRVPRKDWDYASDPFNAVPRRSRLNLVESRKQISDYFQHGAGVRLF